MMKWDGFRRGCVVLQGNVIVLTLVSGDQRKQRNVSQIPNTVRSVETYRLYSIISLTNFNAQFLIQ